MSDETYSFDMARVRLEEIAAQVRKKDISLEKSLDLLEEGVRLANLCTEQIDQTQWRSIVEEASPEADGAETPEVVAAEAAEGVADAEAEAVAEDGGSCEEMPEGAGGVEAETDVPGEDTHAAAEEAPLEDPDVEA